MPYERAAGGYMAARKASKKVINFFVVGLTYGCRRKCSQVIVVYVFSGEIEEITEEAIKVHVREGDNKRK